MVHECSFSDKFHEAKYGTKLYKQKTTNITANKFMLNFPFYFHTEQFSFLRGNFTFSLCIHSQDQINFPVKTEFSFRQEYLLQLNKYK